MLDIYKVQADRQTGAWLTEPEWVGTTTQAEWHARQDTDGVHYDTFELDDTTCAIEVHWQD